MTNPENDRSLGKLIFSLNQKLSPTVFFISCNTEKLRKRLYIAITAETTRFKHIHIDLTPHSVYSLRDAISKFVPDEVKQSPQLTYVVHFTGISSSLFTSEDGEFKKSMLLEEMNFEREILFQDYPFISVLWMTPYFLKELFWKAGDLMSWVFDYYEFTDDSPEAITNKIPYNKPLSKLSAYAERIERIKELENLVESLDEQDVDPKKVMLNQLNAYLLLGQEYMEAFKWKEAETNLLKAKSIAEKTSIDSHSYYISLLNLSSLYRNIKNYEKAIFYLEQILKVIGNLYINSGKVYYELGKVYFEANSLEKALKNFEIAKDRFENSRDLYQIGATYHCIGMIFSKQGNFEKALENYNKAIITYKKSGSVNGIGHTYHNIGIVYTEQERLKEALESFKMAEKLKKNNNYTYDLPNTYNAIGEIYLKQHDWAIAIYYFDKSLEINKKLGNIYGLGYTYFQIGNLYYIQKKWKEALDNFEKAQKSFIETQNEYDLGEIFFQIGNLYKEQNFLTGAKEYFEKAIENFKKHNHPFLSAAEESLARINEKLKHS